MIAGLMASSCARESIVSVNADHETVAQIEPIRHVDGKGDKPSVAQSLSRILEEPVDPDIGQDHPFSSYRHYSADVRNMVRRADIENSACRGGHGDDEITWRACDRRDFLMIELERRGWCRGTRAPGQFDIWLPCSHDYYRNRNRGDRTLQGEG